VREGSGYPRPLPGRHPRNPAPGAPVVVRRTPGSWGEPGGADAAALQAMIEAQSALLAGVAAAVASNANALRLACADRAALARRVEALEEVQGALGVDLECIEASLVELVEFLQGTQPHQGGE